MVDIGVCIMVSSRGRAPLSQLGGCPTECGLCRSWRSCQASSQVTAVPRRRRGLELALQRGNDLLPHPGAAPPPADFHQRTRKHPRPATPDAPNEPSADLDDSRLARPTRSCGSNPGPYPPTAIPHVMPFLRRRNRPLSPPPNTSAPTTTHVRPPLPTSADRCLSALLVVVLHFHPAARSLPLPRSAPGPTKHL